MNGVRPTRFELATAGTTTLRDRDADKVGRDQRSLVQSPRRSALWRYVARPDGADTAAGRAMNQLLVSVGAPAGHRDMASCGGPCPIVGGPVPVLASTTAPTPTP
jgi:hypothetical protein